MTQGVSILHFLEGPSPSIQRILMRLSQHPHFVSTSVQNGRIIYNIEDRPSRIYSEWYSCTIQEKKSSTEDVNADTAKDVVYDLSIKVLEIGKRLSVEDDQTSEGMDISKYADQLPGKNLILAFTMCDCFCTLGEFVESYIGPYHVEIESEQTWPLEPLVRYF